MLRLKWNISKLNNDLLIGGKDERGRNKTKI